MSARRARLWLMATAAALAALPAPAQEALRVRAGEHPAYSRVVIDGRAGMPIEWGMEGRSLQVFVPAGALSTPGAGGLSRIAGFTVTPSAGGSLLRIALTCDCGARVQRLGDGRVVIDVAEGAARPALPAALTAAASPTAARDAVPDTPDPAPQPARAAPPPEVAAPLATPVPPARPARAAVAAGTPTQTPPPDVPAVTAAVPETMITQQVAEPSGNSDTAATPPDSTDESTPPAQAVAAPLPVPETAAAAGDAPAVAEDPATDTETTVAAARSALLRQLTRAAEQGLLTLAEPPETADPAEVPDAAEATPPEAGEPDAAEPEVETAALPVRTTTQSAIERARQAARDAERAESETIPEHCLADDAFALRSWTSEEPLALQLGLGRRALIGEFDRADPRAVLAYVRLLLSHGFGLEAGAALRAFAVELPSTPHLGDLARLVDGEPVAADSAVGKGLDCPGDHHVWALVAAAMDGRLDPALIELNAMRPTLDSLPPRLRTRAVVPVATVALEAGMLTEAETLAGIAARAEPPPPDGDGMLLVLLARIDAAREDWRRAEATLEPLLEQTSPAGIEAMIRMVEFRVARRVAPPPGMAANMEAIAFTLGASDLGRRLLRAAATARASGEGLGLALGALRTLADRGGDAATAQAAARDMLVDFEPDPAEGVAYAEAVLAHEALLGEGAEADRARISIARNFIAIGVETLAERLLAPALARNVPAARLVAAEAATAGWNAPVALDLLDGLDGPEAARARAEALFSMGDYAGAAREAAATGDRDLAARFDWLAGNWAAAAAAGTADRRILAAWMAGNGAMPPELAEAAAGDPALAARADAFAPPETDEPESLLEAASDALEQSRRRRAVMGEILRDG